MKAMCHAAFFVAILALASPVVAKRPQSAWSVSRVTDPITDSTTCVISAYDKFLGLSYTRVGYLYPIVENNPKFGLLVGVSSGGQIRVPVGDVLWRVDDLPFRQLKAVDNPAEASAPMFTYKSGNAANDKLVADAMANSSRVIASMTSTTTAVDGDKAKEMLAEMVAGHGLIFRQATVAPAYGLPSDNTYRVGQFTGEGLKPIPLDESFRAGLVACGIN